MFLSRLAYYNLQLLYNLEATKYNLQQKAITTARKRTSFKKWGGSIFNAELSIECTKPFENL